MVKLRNIFASVLVLMLGLMLSLPVSAADSGSVTLTLECTKLDTPLVGMEWSVFRIGEKDSLGDYHLTGGFSEYKVDINALSTSEMVAASETLEAYAYLDDIAPDRFDTVNEDGVIVFPNMDYGIYLISGKPSVIGTRYYVPAPSIIVLDEDDDEKNVQFNYNVKALPKIKVLAASNKIYNFDATAKKRWIKDEEEKRPQSVEVSLMKDGQLFRTVTLSDKNNWVYTWKNLSSKYKWNVVEKSVPSGYTMTVVENQINIDPNDANIHDMEYVITNSGNYVPPTPTEPPTQAVKPGPPKLPQTGQLWWPVPLCSASGTAVFVSGWVIRSRKRKK